MKRFIESNRQTGSTTALVKAAIETNGYLIVGNLGCKNAICRNHPKLNKNNVFTCAEIERGANMGRLAGAVFFDATAVLEMQNNKKMTIEDLQKIKKEIALEQIAKEQPLTLVKVGGNPTLDELNNWREMLADVSVDPNFKWFSHQSIEIEQIPYSRLNDAIKEDGTIIVPKQEHKHQLNIKLTDEDVKDMEEINKDFFDGEANNSMMGRIILRKGMAVYRKLKSML